MTEDQLQPADTLDDRGVEDVLDEGYSPPERDPASLRGGDSLEERLDAEEPEPDPYLEADHEPGAGDPRAGRLVAGDRDTFAEDVGIDGAGASAEEAAVHVIDEDEVGPETEPDPG